MAKTKKKLGPPDMESLAKAAECLKVLAHPVRIRMVQLLLHGRYTVGEIAEDCDIAENLASEHLRLCLLYTSPSPRDATLSRMPSSA